MVASPKFGPWWLLWVRVCPWPVCAPKHPNYTLTNLLFGLCRSVWIIELRVNLPSPHLGALKRPFTFEMLWTKEHTPILSPSIIFTFKLVAESIKELGGASSLSSILFTIYCHNIFGLLWEKQKLQKPFKRNYECFAFNTSQPSLSCPYARPHTWWPATSMPIMSFEG